MDVNGTTRIPNGKAGVEPGDAAVICHAMTAEEAHGECVIMVAGAKIRGVVCLARVHAFSVAVPNVDVGIGHRLALVVDDTQTKAHRKARLAFADVFALGRLVVMTRAEHQLTGRGACA
jgi:hypothetical protein